MYMSASVFVCASLNRLHSSIKFLFCSCATSPVYFVTLYSLFEHHPCSFRHAIISVTPQRIAVSTTSGLCAASMG